MEHKSYLANKKKLKEVKEDYMETLEDNQYLDEDNISNLDLPMPYFKEKLNFAEEALHCHDRGIQSQKSKEPSFKKFKSNELIKLDKRDQMSSWKQKCFEQQIHKLEMRLAIFEELSQRGSLLKETRPFWPSIRQKNWSKSLK